MSHRSVSACLNLVRFGPPRRVAAAGRADADPTTLVANAFLLPTSGPAPERPWRPYVEACNSLARSDDSVQARDLAFNTVEEIADAIRLDLDLTFVELTDGDDLARLVYGWRRADKDTLTRELGPESERLEAALERCQTEVADVKRRRRGWQCERGRRRCREGREG